MPTPTYPFALCIKAFPEIQVGVEMFLSVHTQKFKKISLFLSSLSQIGLFIVGDGTLHRWR